MTYVNCTLRVHTHTTGWQIDRAFLYGADGCVTHTHVCVCLVDISMAFSTSVCTHAGM